MPILKANTSINILLTSRWTVSVSGAMLHLWQSDCYHTQGSPMAAVVLCKQNSQKEQYHIEQPSIALELLSTLLLCFTQGYNIETAERNFKL
eukprot:9764-Heterococcus_DN1.PRE.1